MIDIIRLVFHCTYSIISQHFRNIWRRRMALRVAQGYWKIHHSIDFRVHHCNCVNSEIKRDIGRNRDLTYATCIPRRHVVWESHVNITINLGTEKLEWWMYQVVEKFDKYVHMVPFTIHQRVGQTNGHHMTTQAAPRIASRGKNWQYTEVSEMFTVYIGCKTDCPK